MFKRGGIQRETRLSEKQIHQNEEELAERFDDSESVIQLLSCEDNYSAASLI